MNNRVNVLGVGISVLNLKTALGAMATAVRERRKGYICVTGVHGVMEAQDDAMFKKILNEAFLCTPDGMPMVWAGKINGNSEMSRVYGPDLMLDVNASSNASYNEWNVDSYLATHWGPKHLPLDVVVPITIVYILIFVSGVVGNVAVCAIIVRNPSMHTATNCYLFSLAISDLTVLLFGKKYQISIDNLKVTIF